jgi:CRP/FNR family transcriptional regulator
MIAADELHALAPFRDVSPPVIAALATQAADRRYAAGTVLFEAGGTPRGWYVIVEGKVRVLRGTGARRHVIHTEGTGGTLGEVPLFSGGTHPATAIAAEPTRCALFSRAALEAAIAKNPAVAFALLERLALRVRELVTRLDGRSSMSVHTRLVDFIRSRPRSPRTLAVSLGMTQQALAEELGTVREVVARELRLLCRDGTLQSLGGGRYLVCDPPVRTNSIR